MSERSATIWDRLATCVSVLDEPFRAGEIVRWFRRHHPDVNEASLRAHIQSATSNVPASSKIAGFASRRPLITRVGHGVYVRYVDDDAPPYAASTTSLQQAEDVVLLACSRSKADTARAARELYLGPVFTKGRDYAERRGKPWFVISGKWGLLSPDDVVAPYDLHLGSQSPTYQAAWGEWVATQLSESFGSLDGATVELFAGQSYVNPLRGPLQRLGARLSEPLRGRRMGEQLAWFDAPEVDENESKGEAPTERPRNEGEGIRVLNGPVEGGVHEYRWPTEVERFDASWRLSVERAGKVFSVRHCLGERQVYGSRRRHSVTFVDGAPEVEGVATDDYSKSLSLISPLKGADRKLVRRRSDVPGAYADLPLVDHHNEIRAPYSRDAVAVKLREDDAVGWATYALIRIQARQSSLRVAAESSTTAPARTARESSRSDTAGIVRALLELNRSGLDAEWVGTSSFTPNEAANQLLVDDAFAFLLGVIFDQGIPAERAWEAPYQLKSRLGHLNPGRMVEEQSAVWEAINTQPKLHRYVEKVPGWVVAAAGIVSRDYRGDAAAIWAGAPTARELQQRLNVFPGIGQKKAAMAVELLERDLGVPVREMHGSDVAYDVHVRRVFLRTRLARADDLDHMVEVARAVNPDRPGEIDLPAWHVGRTWCRAGTPLCESCPLGQVCPRDVEAASRVRGA